jgi:hypothetical protein
VATDQKAGTIAIENERASSIIENELPTYRAISAIAILSVVCGGLAVFSFAHPVFFALAILAVGSGILAHRRIRRFPDMLTGHGLANAGILLGLVFGLAAGTILTVQYVVRTSQAERFARKFAGVVKSPNMGQVLRYMRHPDQVKDKTDAQLLQEYDKTKEDQRNMMEMMMGPMGELIKLRGRLLDSKDQEVRFIRLEGLGDDDTHGLELQIYAFALYEITGPTTSKYPDPQQYALAILKARQKGRQYEWWVETIRYPYKPSTYAPTTKPVDDGHGHAH